ncbi:cytochrome P450 [Nonomuraea typhae]|uniref:cytochrome P450 n=1 Tax=Nonomuraea typhae TaxID=2603600 RepID=UPI0012FABE80|nr:cytochrome P450 [Nonomuraea typhae]
MRNLPFERPTPFSPTPVHAELRRTAPIARVVTPAGQPAWIIVEAELARQVLTDPRFTMAPPGAHEENASLLSDGAAHARLRRLLSRAFTPRALESLRPRITELARDLVTDLRRQGPGADLVTVLARPLPLGVTCDMLGIEAPERFYAWADAASGITGGGIGFEEAWAELNAYFPELIAAKRAQPGPDLLSAVIAVRDADDGRLSDGELHTIAISLVFGGYLTVANALSIGVVHLLTTGGLGRIAHLPAPAVVEEMLRYSAGLSGEAFPRHAQEDLTLAGAEVRAGDQVLVRLEAANQDPALIPDPSRFDPSRTPNPHLSFGHGPHHCLGAALGRMELTAALEALTTQIPTLALACPPEDIPWTGNPLDDGPASLPVTF